MSTISSLGVGSNLDLSGLLDRLAAAESLPLVALQKQQTSYTAKLSAYGTLQGALSNLQAAAAKLADAKLYESFKPSASAPDVVSATATTGAVPASYAVEVTRLATAQSLAAAGVADPKAAIGLGTLTFSFGTISGGTLDTVAGQYSGAAFNPDAARPSQDLVIDASNNSLEGLRDSINKATGLGVSASIINDGGSTPYRLVLTSSTTGAASSLSVSVAGDASLNTLMGHDPAGVQALQQTRAAGNAALSLNGLAVSSASNVLKDAVQGVSLTLSKIGSSTIDVQRDTSVVEAAANAFVATYNALLGNATVLTRYDEKKQTGAPLMGDSTLRAVQTRLRATLNTPQAGELQVLSRVGISFEKDGTLSLNTAKLNKAFADNPASVAELFAGRAAGEGFGTQVAAVIGSFTASDGMLSSATSGIKSTLKSLDVRYAATEITVQGKVDRFRAQFTQLDLVMSRMNSTTAYLQQQFAAMNGGSK